MENRVKFTGCIFLMMLASLDICIHTLGVEGGVQLKCYPSVCTNSACACVGRSVCILRIMNYCASVSECALSQREEGGGREWGGGRREV